jgi:cytochrome c oxidase subunit 4
MDKAEKHILGYKALFLVWLILMILTAITVWVSRIDLGFLNIFVALLVASTKALLVILFFMHLKYENRLFKFSVFLAFLILALFIGFVFFDVKYR